MWKEEINTSKSLNILSKIMVGPSYLSWWQLADTFPEKIRFFETVAKLVCRSSRLKVDDCAQKRTTHASRMCTQCDLGLCEDLNHIVLTCPQYEGDRIEMYRKIAETGLDIPNEEMVKVVLGGYCGNFSFVDLIPVWLITSEHINEIYTKVLKIKSRYRLGLDKFMRTGSDHGLGH